MVCSALHFLGGLYLGRCLAQLEKSSRQEQNVFISSFILFLILLLLRTNVSSFVNKCFLSTCGGAEVKAVYNICMR